MAFFKYLIDIVRNGSPIQQNVNVERDATDTTVISPARVIQLNGLPLSPDNALPVKLSSNTDLGSNSDSVATSDTGSFSLVALIKRLLTKLPTLVGGRLPVDGSGVTQPVNGFVTVSGTVAVSNFPSSTGGGSSGTQYTDGAVQSLPVGTVAFGSNSGTLKSLQLDTTNRLITVNSDIGVLADVAATADTGSFSLLSGLKRFLARFTTYLGVFGTLADVADSTGSLMARLRAAIDRLGSFGDVASSTGSVMAQLRHISDSLNRSMSITAISESLSGDRTIITATAGRAIRISSLYYTVDNSSAVITLKAGTTNISGTMPILDHAGDYPNPLPLPVATAFVINVSVAANLRGYVIWYLV